MAETNSLLNCRTGNRTGGSNPPASAVKGVNQRVTWFTPFFAPKKSLVGIFDPVTSMALCFSIYLAGFKPRSTIWIKLDWRDLGISVSLDRKRYSFIKGVPYDWQIFG